MIPLTGGRQLLAELRGGGRAPSEVAKDLLQPGVVTNAKDGTAVLKAFSTSSLWQEALSLLDSLLHRGAADIILCNAAMATCGKANRWDAAMSLLNSMRQAHGLQPDVFTYGTLLSAQEEWPSALWLLSVMLDEQVQPNVISFNAAIKSCSVEGAALSMLSWMRELQVVPNIITFNSAICSAKELETALSLQHQLHQQGLKEDIYTYNALLSLYERLKRWDLAFDLIEEMSTPPDVMSFSTAISACEKGQKWEVAVALFDQMCHMKLQPNAFSLSALVSACEACCEWQRALAVFFEYHHRVGATAVLHGSAITACAKGTAWVQALLLLRSMEGLRLQKSAIAHNSALTALARAKQWQAALAEAEREDLDSMGVAEVIRSCASAQQWSEMRGVWQRFRGEPDAPLLTLMAYSLECSGFFGDLPRLVSMAEVALHSLPRRRKVQADHGVILLELLDEFDLATSYSVQSSLRTRYATTQHALAKLQDSRLPPSFPRAILEESFSLGAIFTSLQLGNHELPWIQMARRACRNITWTGDEDLTAGMISAWHSKALGVPTVQQEHSGSVVGQAEEGASPDDRLLPIFAGHDRSSHAERQALLSVLRGLAQCRLTDHMSVFPQRHMCWEFWNGTTKLQKCFACTKPDACVLCADSISF